MFKHGSTHVQVAADDHRMTKPVSSPAHPRNRNTNRGLRDAWDVVVYLETQICDHVAEVVQDSPDQSKHIHFAQELILEEQHLLGSVVQESNGNVLHVHACAPIISINI